VDNKEFNSKEPFQLILGNHRGGVTLMLLAFLGCFIVAGIYQLNRTNDVNLSATKSISQNNEIDMIENEAKMFLRNKYSCKDSFYGRSFDATPNGATTIKMFGLVNGTYVADANHVLTTGTLLRVDDSIVEFSEIVLKDPTAAWMNINRPAGTYPPTAGMATLWVELRFTKKNQKLSLSNIMGLSHLVRTIPIEVTWQDPAASPPVIESCYYDSSGDDNLWVRDTCTGLFGGTILKSLCTDINVKNSISTDGHFCFNELDGNPNTPGNIHRKDCINSWYFERLECVGKGPAGTVNCAADEIMVGFAASSCGKGCVQATATCCKQKLGQ
jgi:hypothetical protein